MLSAVEPPNGPGNYQTCSGVWLLRGFLHQRRGDPMAARQAWRRGTWKSYLQQSKSPRQEPPHLTSTGGLYNIIMVSLGDEPLSGEESQRLLARGLSRLNLSADTRQRPLDLKEMWQTPRGRDIAGKIAFHEVAFSESVRLPFLLAVSETMRRGAFAGELAADQDALLWKLSEELFELWVHDKLSQTQVLQLGLAWKGVTGFLGWDAVAPTLPAAQRGPLAYVFGQRLLRRSQPREARTLLTTARDLAGPGTALRRLAQDALDQIKAP